jgi:hypothetical protein
MKFVFGLILVIISSLGFSQVYFFPKTEEAKSFLESLESSSEIKKLLTDEIDHLNASERFGLWRITLNEVESLSSGNFAQIYPRYSSGQPLEIVLDITSEGIKNPAVLMEQMIHLDQIVGNESYSSAIKRTFISPIQWAETVSNAQQGSPSAIKKIAATKLEAYLQMSAALKDSKFPKMTGVSEEVVLQYIEQQKSSAQSVYDLALKNEKKLLKEAKKKWDQQREKFPTLEAQSEKLNDLIAKNDRAGVRKLLEDYLPWPLMEPTERKVWVQWLDALENPNLQNRRVVFRGLDGDSLQMGAEGKPYQMSTVLTKNQGNYNRRLRSLTTMREKFGVDHLKKSITTDLPQFQGHVTLSTMMRNHSDDPVGSPFLSGSSNDVTERFGAKKRIALHIDQRRIISNIHSTYPHEKELLIPLIIFPDEVLYYEDKSKSVEYIKDENFLKEVEARLGRPLKPFEKEGWFVDKKEFLKTGLAEFHEQILSPESKLSVGCVLDSKGCDCLYMSLSNLLK